MGDVLTFPRAQVLQLRARPDGVRRHFAIGDRVRLPSLGGWRGVVVAATRTPVAHAHDRLTVQLDPGQVVCGRISVSATRAEPDQGGAA